MSGHSKWSKVKHQKKSTDAVKSREFTKASRAISVAVKEGGGVTDPDKNFRLRLAIDKARSVNMPKDTIDRAVSKAADAKSQAIDQVLYEGYGPGGVAILVSAVTDNRQRTSAEVRNIFSHAGGSLAEPGAVGFQFVRSGVIVLEKHPDKPYDRLLEICIGENASDVTPVDDAYEVYADADHIVRLKETLESEGWVVDNWEVIMKPVTPFAPDEKIRKSNEALMEELQSMDDVQEVYSTLS